MSKTIIEQQIKQAAETGELDLSWCELDEIPAGVFDLQGLRKLCLYNNQLTAIPDSIGQLQNLTHLWLDDNQLTIIPDSIGQLQNLRGLRLDGNPLKSIPAGLEFSINE